LKPPSRRHQVSFRNGFGANISFAREAALREIGNAQDRITVRTLYNILFTIFFVLSSPYYFWRMQRRGNWAEGFLQRFGIYDTKLKQALTNRQTIWLHAVSVGEVNICT